MKRLLLPLLLFFLIFTGAVLRAQYAASNFTLVGHTDPETTYNDDSLKYSGCWGWYQADKNKEYAIACSHKGTYWIDITVPTSPTVSAYRPAKVGGATWREAKSYKNYLYVISDDFGNTFQIFDMKYLPDSVHKVYDGINLFRQGHTLWIEDSLLYVASVTRANTFSTMCVYSLANPVAPVKLRALDDDYTFINHVHDMYVRHDTVYASCGYQGMYVFQFNGSAFSMLGSLTTYTASGYNHSSAITPYGNTMVFADEVPGGLPVKVCDVSSVSNIQVLATAQQFPQTTPHNPFIPNNELCFLSSYQDGLQLYDISNPSSPQLAGYFDTYPQGGGNVNNYAPGKTYAGQWGCYPFFPSGNVFALDRLNGAFVLHSSLYGGPLIDLDVTLPGTACQGSSYVPAITATGANSVTWSGAGLSITPASGFSTTITFTAPGVHTLSVTASNSGSSTAVVRTITVTSVAASATATNPSCSTCTNGVVQLTTSAGTPPFSYSWSPSGGTGAVASGLAQGCYTVIVTDAATCRDTVKVCLVGSTVGLKEIKASGIRLFPNPVDDKLFVEIPADVHQYAIHNLLGEKVMSGHASPGVQALDVSALPRGLYMLTLSGAKAANVSSFVVE